MRIEADQVDQAIECIHGSLVYRLRGHLLPLVHLRDVLQLGAGGAALGDPESDGESRACNIVVLRADDQPFGLVVDRIQDTQEIVVKPLGNQIKGIPEFAGATIMGDGRVALILDVLGLAQRASIVSDIGERSSRSGRDSSSDAAVAGERQTLLVISAGQDRRVAIATSLVARLEEIDRRRVEHGEDREVVQYRGQIMPLIHLASALGAMPSGYASEEEPLQVVVFKQHGRSVGIVVERILDIVEQRIEVKRSADGYGRLGSIVVQGQVTDLIDLEALVRAMDPTFFDMTEDAA